MEDSRFSGLDVYQVDHRLDVVKVGLECPYSDCGAYTIGVGPVISTIGHEHIPSRYIAVNCESCKRAVLLELNDVVPPTHLGAVSFANFREIVRGLSVVNQLPRQTAKMPYGAVPPKLSRDYIEAQACLSVAAWRASALMARRCMESICDDLGGKGRDLFAKINDLEKRQVLTPDLARLAHNVRVFGKHGAHPISDALDTLQQDDAKIALDLCGYMFLHCYEMKEKTKEIETRIKELETTSTPLFATEVKADG